VTAPVTGPPVVDPFAVGRSIAGGPVLRAFSVATVLDAVDVHTAVTLGRLAARSGDTADEAVLLAAALAVRAVRLGHVYVDLATVAGTAAPEDEEVDVDLTGLPWPDPASWPDRVAGSRLTAVGADGPPDRPLRLIHAGPARRLYLDRYWRHERTVAGDLLRRSAGEPPALDAAELAGGLRRLFPDDGGDDLQRRAAATAVQRRLAVVAGGPGTGKTTTVARILALLNEQAAALGQAPPRVALAAPTGKAAARLAEAVHAEAAMLDVDPAVRAALIATPASTLHRLLGFQPGTKSRFRHDGANQLGHTVVIVDESSMVSLSLMAKLLVAVRPTARLVLVGDPRQLASVEAGAVLGDIVGGAGSGAGAGAPAGRPQPVMSESVVVLRRVHRFGAGIASVAGAIEAGNPAAVIDALRSSPGEVTWIDPAPGLDPGRAAELSDVRQAVTCAAGAVVAAARAGDGAGALAALRSVQVLCAHRRGPAGAARWRAEIERWLRLSIAGYGGGTWFAGRPLLVTENDYGLGVFNGDTGVVVDAGAGRLRAVFDRRGEVLAVRPTRLASVESLYAMTIHKAQGSQFDQVVVVLPEPGSRALTRELLYTAVTRARTSLTLIGSEASVAAAVNRPIARASGLGDALWPRSNAAGADRGQAS
jgi:exodeoxyribonuclease V alpha subunit